MTLLDLLMQNSIKVRISEKFLYIYSDLSLKEKSVLLKIKSYRFGVSEIKKPENEITEGYMVYAESINKTKIIELMGFKEEKQAFILLNKIIKAIKSQNDNLIILKTQKKLKLAIVFFVFLLLLAINLVVLRSYLKNNYETTSPSVAVAQNTKQQLYDSNQNGTAVMDAQTKEKELLQLQKYLAAKQAQQNNQQQNNQQTPQQNSSKPITPGEEVTNSLNGG